ncbi:unnamed protein product [Ectocarpus sp. 6 AP-2014]
MPADHAIQIVLAYCIVPLLSFLVVLRSVRKAKGFYSRDGERSGSTVHAVIASVATGTPQYRCTQEQALRVASKVPGTKSVRPTLERLYRNTCIGSRHFAVPDFTPQKRAEGDKALFPADGSYEVPVDVRLAKFKQKAAPLVCDVSLRAIKESGVDVSQIGKLVVVSSTGFSGPGLDCDLIKNLGLPRSVDRTMVGLMGCAGALHGLRVASDFVIAHPGECALMVCVELSSLHANFQDNTANAVSMALFADGCAATVLKGARKAECPKGSLVVADSHSWLIEDSEDGITVDIEPNSIVCVLSKLVPKIVANSVGPFVDGFLGRNSMKRKDVDFWVVHPGGSAIITEVQNGLGLTEEHTADSWAVLGEYGNMLSPTSMFVLSRVFQRHKAIVAEGKAGYQTGMAIAFSPGVGAEGILFKQI